MMLPINSHHPTIKTVDVLNSFVSPSPPQAQKRRAKMFVKEMIEPEGCDRRCPDTDVCSCDHWSLHTHWCHLVTRSHGLRGHRETGHHQPRTCIILRNWGCSEAAQPLPCSSSWWSSEHAHWLHFLVGLVWTLTSSQQIRKQIFLFLNLRFLILLRFAFKIYTLNIKRLTMTAVYKYDNLHDCTLSNVSTPVYIMHAYLKILIDLFLNVYEVILKSWSETFA